jgi:hypothetical protein
MSLLLAAELLPDLMDEDSHTVRAVPQLFGKQPRFTGE